MSNKVVKVAITGGAGHLGYALLFRIASGEMFGSHTKVELSLLELEGALPVLQGVAMELEDGAFPLLQRVSYTANMDEAMKGANWVLLVGAAPRRAGMQRADLLKINGGIFAEQGEAINRCAAKDVRVLVVGNPCNTNCLIAMNYAKDIPNDRFYAMTMLDEKRARTQLAIKAGVPVASVKNMAIWGNHSLTQYPDFSHATIDGKPVTEAITDINWLQNSFIEIVQKRGAAVIAARGSSSAASASNAIICSVRNLLTDTPEGECYSMALCSMGQYDVTPGLIYSFPCRTRKSKLEVIGNLRHNDFALDKLSCTLQELEDEREAVREMGLLS